MPSFATTLVSNKAAFDTSFRYDYEFSSNGENIISATIEVKNIPIDKEGYIDIKLQYQITKSVINIRLQYQITISDITFFVSLTISSGYSKSLRTFTPPLTSEIPFVSLYV